MLGSGAGENQDDIHCIKKMVKKPLEMIVRNIKRKEKKEENMQRQKNAACKRKE